MRISDWSSDVCSSDLGGQHRDLQRLGRVRQGLFQLLHQRPLEHRRIPQAPAVVAVRCVDDDAAARAGGPRRIRRRWDQLRSEEHTSELQSLMRISYAVFCLKKKKERQNTKKDQSLHTKQLRKHNTEQNNRTRSTINE